MPGDYTLGVEVRAGAPNTHPAAPQAVAAQVLTPAGSDGLPVASANGALLTTVSLQ